MAERLRDIKVTIEVDTNKRTITETIESISFDGAATRAEQVLEEIKERLEY